jgi:hypothetical protein
MTVKVTDSIENDRDGELLPEILSLLLDQICWSVKMSYGDEIHLHIGDKVPSPRRKSEDDYQGSWVVGTRGAPWTLTGRGRSIASSEEAIEEIEKRLTVLEGMPVTAIDIQYPEAILIWQFDGDYLFTITPDRNEESELADWEILTPERTILQSVRTSKNGS